ncbi:unnamed protein product [Ectocarpus sp. CCAP 1310/34]|nr:unnamed protein product [Ectocarpus sp. CCAP 1310/34]
MLSALDIRYFSWPYFFALLILSAGVIAPLIVMKSRPAALFRTGSGRIPE